MLSSRQRKALLVDGYIREHEKLLNLSHIIPTSIYALIFEFRLLSEKWNKELTNSNAIISYDRSCVDITNDIFCVISGTHYIKYGQCFYWELKMMKQIDITPTCIVVLAPPTLDLCDIKDAEGIKECIKTGGYAWNGESGEIWYGSNDNCEIRKYGKSGGFKNAEDTLEITFNWEFSALHISLNGDDFGICLLTDNMGQVTKTTDNKLSEYRLRVCVMNANGVRLIINGEEE